MLGKLFLFSITLLAITFDVVNADTQDYYNGHAPPKYKSVNKL